MYFIRKRNQEEPTIWRREISGTRWIVPKNVDNGIREKSLSIKVDSSSGKATISTFLHEHEWQFNKVKFEDLTITDLFIIRDLIDESIKELENGR